MPGAPLVRGRQTQIAVGIRKPSERVLDDRIRKLLELINKVDKLNIPENTPEKTIDSRETSQLLSHVGASGLVLMKNENDILPFKKEKTLAVIGPNSKIACYSGGGSANLRPYYVVTPFEGISARSKTVRYALGAVGYRNLPVLSYHTKTKEGKRGLTAKFYTDPPESPSRKPVEVVHVENSDILLSDYSHPEVRSLTFYMDLEGTFTPEEDGEYIFGLSVCGIAKFFIDDSLIINNTENQRPGDTFFSSGTVEEKGSMMLKAGKTYNVYLQFGSSPTSKMKTPGATVMAGSGLRLGGTKKTEPQAEINKAVQLVKEVDQVVICAGLNADWESEGYDRKHMDLPGYTNALISAVVTANPNTAVILQSGTPVTMPWINEVPALVHAWYGGNETGNAIADVLFGDVNPSGKLPLSFPIRNEDNPAFLNFRTERGRTMYGEDIYIGYRFYEKTKREVLFPFGHGLSYTSFEIRSLQVIDDATSGKLKVAVEVENTGEVEGKGIVQVYVSQHSPSINRPPKELRGFAKVSLSPRESKEVSVEIPKKYAVSFWDEDRDMWIMENDTYDVLVGSSSARMPLKGNFKVEKTEWWKGL